MELSTIFDTIINNFNFGLILSINVTVYFIIHLLSAVIKKPLNKILKIIITVCCSFGLGLIYWKISDIPSTIVLNSCICATLVWDWFLKPILKKVKLDYAKNNLEQDL